MLSIPAITATPVSTLFVERETRRSAFQGDIARTHDGLSDVLETVIDVPRHLYQTGVLVDRQERVGVEDRVQTVQLVRHGGRVDGNVRVVVDGLREVVVILGRRDLDVA
jgi:hypothetical protein